MILRIKKEHPRVDIVSLRGFLVGWWIMYKLITKNSKQQGMCLAVLGAGSDVGKSIVATALCRIFADQGVRTAPLKVQNMSNNLGVTPEGLEMERAQIVQTETAGIPQQRKSPDDHERQPHRCHGIFSHPRRIVIELAQR